MKTSSCYVYILPLDFQPYIVTIIFELFDIIYTLILYIFFRKILGCFIPRILWMYSLKCEPKEWRLTIIFPNRNSVLYCNELFYYLLYVLFTLWRAFWQTFNEKGPFKISKHTTRIHKKRQYLLGFQLFRTAST